MPEIEKLLKREVVGRIGCTDGDIVYVVPISFVYDGSYIYCHTHEGLKTELMRKRPKICFEVDQLRDMANWQSAIVQDQLAKCDRTRRIRRADGSRASRPCAEADA